MRYILYLIFSLFGICSIQAQPSTSIIEVSLLDAESGAALSFCNIRANSNDEEPEKIYTSNDEGMASIAFRPNIVLEVTYLGYRTIVDTLHEFIPAITYMLEPDPYNLEQIVITGQNKPVRADKSIYSVKLIGQRQIEQMASNNLAELLDDELNVQISNDPSLGSSIKLQGITGENVKILIDGVPVIGRLDGNIDLSQINLSEVDHVEIIEGPMSVIYGSNALAGVINIITKEHRRSDLYAELDSYYESVGVYNMNGSFNLNKNNNAFGLSFGRNFFEGYSIDPDSRSKQWKPKEQYNSKVQYTIKNKNLKIRIKTDLFRERLLDRNNPSPPH